MLNWLKKNYRLEKDAKEIWTDNIPSEIDYWERFITEQANSDKLMKWLRYEDAFIPDEIAKLLPENMNKYEFLDVGSGMRCWYGNAISGKTVNLTLCDPLADRYSDILLKHGLPEIIKVNKADAEKLLETFYFNQFDIVTARNCLDHSYSPEHCILQMLSVSKKYVYLLHCLNTGKTAGYAGLHKWDFDLEGNDFIIKGTDSKVNITQKYSHLFAHSVRIVTKKAYWLNVDQCWLEVILEKRI